MTKARRLLVTSCIVSLVVVLAHNGWLVRRAVDAQAHTAALARSITPDSWTRLVNSVAKLGAAVMGLLLASSVMRRGLRAAEGTLSRWNWLNDSDRSLPALFNRVQFAIVRVGWLLIAVLARWLFGLPATAADTVPVDHSCLFVDRDRPGLDSIDAGIRGVDDDSSHLDQGETGPSRGGCGGAAICDQRGLRSERGPCPGSCPRGREP
jgi:hypothetical protein